MYISVKDYDEILNEVDELTKEVEKLEESAKLNKDTEYHLRTERTEALLENDSLKSERQELLEEIKSLKNAVTYLKSTNQVLNNYILQKEAFCKTCNPKFAEESAKLFPIIKIIRIL